MTSAVLHFASRGDVRIPPADFNCVRDLLLAHQWIYAKTMLDNPHWYTIRKRWQRDEDLAWTVEAIRRCGYEEIFEGRSNRPFIPTVAPTAKSSEGAVRDFSLVQANGWNT